MTKDSADPTPAAPEHAARAASAAAPAGRAPSGRAHPQAGLPVDRVPGAAGSTGQEGTPGQRRDRGRRASGTHRDLPKSALLQL